MAPPAEKPRSGVYAGAVETLRSIEEIRSPMKKLACIKQTCDEICATIKEQFPEKTAGELAISADDLLPLFSYVLIQAAPQHFESWLHMIENFLPENMEKGEGGYYCCIARIILGSLMEAASGAAGRQRGQSSPEMPRPETLGTPHTVQFSETLSGIATQYGIAVEQLAEANQLPEHLSLYPGQTIYIPQPPPSGVDALLLDGLPLGASSPSPQPSPPPVVDTVPQPGGAAAGNPDDWWQ